MKYKLGEKHPTQNLYRVVALKDFGNVKEGDLGGWVEGEHNLSQDGNAWVYGDARVYENACVYGKARVFGNACVSGKTRVSGNAWVSGNASPKREWVGLTDDEFRYAIREWNDTGQTVGEMICAIEAKLKEKNT